MEDVKCSHKGLRFRNEYHGHPERLTAFFKQNFNRPIPPKKSDRPAPAPVPEQPRVVKKEEPRDFTVKDEAPSMDIKPTPQQLGVSSFQNQVRLLSFGSLSRARFSLNGWVVTQPPPPPPQQQQSGHSAAYEATLQADAARFAKQTQESDAARFTKMKQQPPAAESRPGSWVTVRTLRLIPPWLETIGQCHRWHSRRELAP